MGPSRTMNEENEKNRTRPSVRMDDKNKLRRTGRTNYNDFQIKRNLFQVT